MSAFITLADLSWSTPDGRPLFSNLELSFDAGRTGLVGRNGVGKTTLLKLVSGDLQPVAGRVTIKGTLGILRQAIQVVLDGGSYVPPDIDLSQSRDSESAKLAARLASLTPQQVRVLMMLSEGLLNKQIAYELSVSEATVKAHVSAILTKLGVDSRTQAVIAASKIAADGWTGQALNG